MYRDLVFGDHKLRVYRLSFEVGTNWLEVLVDYARVERVDDLWRASGDGFGEEGLSQLLFGEHQVLAVINHSDRAVQQAIGFQQCRVDVGIRQLGDDFASWQHLVDRIPCQKTGQHQLGGLSSCHTRPRLRVDGLDQPVGDHQGAKIHGHVDDVGFPFVQYGVGGL